MKNGAQALIPACARGEERRVILWITAPFDFRPFSARFTINNAQVIRMLTCTGGAPPLVARAHAPVCPSVPQLGYATGVQIPAISCGRDNVNMGAFS